MVSHIEAVQIRYILHELEHLLRTGFWLDHTDACGSSPHCAIQAEWKQRHPQHDRFAADIVVWIKNNPPPWAQDQTIRPKAGYRLTAEEIISYLDRAYQRVSASN
jgi:hypothetical protein